MAEQHKTDTAEKAGAPGPNPATEDAQRARAAETANAGVVSAKDNQPVATRANMSKAAVGRTQGSGVSSQAPHTVGIKTDHETDKIADLQPAERPVANVPTQDPPINVAGKVPVGSSRVDFAAVNPQPAVEHRGPGGHLGPSGPPAQVQRSPNPPVAPRGGVSRG